jgi:uncharacterized protein
MVGMRTGRMVVDVAGIRRVAGTRKRIERSAVLAGLAVADVAVVEDAAVEVDAVLESVSDQVVVAGTVRADWVGSCRRCLDEVTGRIEVDVREVFDPRPVEGETYRLAGDSLDLEPMVRDAVLLNLPLAPICDDACPGPDPEHPVGADGTAPAGAEGEPEPDPRWAALRDLRFE